MGERQDNGTDQASIKPVASLRSMFEGKTRSDSSTTTAPNLLTARALINPERRQDGNRTLNRASMDIPRAPSPWLASEGVAESQRKPGPPIPRPRRPNSRILQRPLSTTSLSIARSPPLVTIDSPKSPLRSPPAPRPSSSIKVIPLPPRIEPISRERLNRCPATSSTNPETDKCANASGTKPPRDPSADHSGQLVSMNLPPPVNRTEKPVVPTKHPFFPGKTSLEPLVPKTDEKKSPFSSPPSSDEAVDMGTSTLSRASEAKGQRNVLANFQKDRCHRSMISRPHEANQGGERAASPGLKRVDARHSGFTPRVSTDPRAIVPEIPPGLPPRRGQHQQAASAHGNKPLAADAPFLDHSNVVPEKSELVSMTSNTSHPTKNGVFRSFSPFGESEIVPENTTVGEQESDPSSHSGAAAVYPDLSNTNRCPPVTKNGVREIDTNYDTRLVDICSRYVATTGHTTKVWDVLTGEEVLSVGHSEKEVRVTSLAFKPATTADEEGSSLWLGTNSGDIQEWHIPTQNTIYVRTGPHERRELVKIYRHQSSMWTLDDGGKLCVWLADDTGLPNLRQNPSVHRVPKGHTFSIIVQDHLWFATGKDIRIFRPGTADAAGFAMLQEPLNQPGVGAITSGAIVGGQLDRLYFGHADGKVTIYSSIDFSCLGVVSTSVYKISSLAGAGIYLWAGYSSGTIYAYDTRTQPWTTKKDWLAHSSPTLCILVDRSSLWKSGVLRVVSLGADNALRFWDGALKEDWLATDLQDHDVEYCSFRELTALVLSWNAGAATPPRLRDEERDSRFFHRLLQTDKPPDLLVFGFQELVDLDDKKLTARTFFKGNKKKDPAEQEHMSHQYRVWRDYLIRCIEDTMPSSEPYHLLHTASMVGLFSCVFIKASQRHRVHHLSAAEIKRGMGGLHGNKGALILRFILDDSSICLVNCHLAAGQTQTVNRNNDITAILESAILPPSRNASMGVDTFVGGGDGSMILDHEICILNGDLNYRIDTMGRDTVIKAVNANNLSKLLERDQLLVSQRRNPGFRVRAFKECPITFDPTYKYDVGSDRYDTSEKRRAPAWCDRILYRGPGKVKQVDYRRHDLRVSDHRPVTGRFKLRIKKISVDQRAVVSKDSERRFEKARQELAQEVKIEYLRDVLGVPPNEAKRLI